MILKENSGIFQYRATVHPFTRVTESMEVNLSAVFYSGSTTLSPQSI
jgi:hypothetical protein